MTTRQVWKPGDWAIYVKQKRSVSPGPRARNVMPASSSNFYSYLVEKCWIVQEVLGDHRLKLITRRGKVHVIDADDPRLRKPTLWQRVALRARFRSIEHSRNDTEGTLGN